MKRKRILYAAIRYPYADPARGLSYEYYNFLDSLRQMREVVVEEFDWVARLCQVGKRRMNQELVWRVEQFKPDLVFFSLFRDEFLPETVEVIGHKAQTYNWFCDDVTRFEGFVREWAPRFSAVSTVTKSLVPRYRAIGQPRVISLQFASNPRVYRRLSLSKRLETSFVGQAHSNRKRLVAEMGRHGVAVNTFGVGWSSGGVCFERMVEIFNETKVNINFTGVSFSFPWGRYLPWWWQPAGVLPAGEEALVNGRLFEVPMCGGFLLTGPAFDLEAYFVPGTEVDVYHSVAELVEKAKFYVAHERERQRIALAGYRRARREHTYVRRFRQLFDYLGI